jgi:hypothetical protein
MEGETREGWKRWEIHKKLWYENMKETDNLEDLGVVDMRITATQREPMTLIIQTAYQNEHSYMLLHNRNPLK